MVLLTPLTAAQTMERAKSALTGGRGAGLPELLSLIKSLTNNLKKATIAEIAELVEKDAAVMSRLLTIANTIVHNPHVEPMSSVHHAIHQIGFQRIRSLAVSLMLIENTGAAGNPTEQRAAAAQALCAGLLAQGIARAQGTVDPETAFAAAALRQFGHIILPAISLEHLRAARERARTMPEETAYRGMFGLTPPELTRRLLASSRLPEEITRSLRDCEPETFARLPLSNDTRLLGICDLGGRLAKLSLDPALDREAYLQRSRQLVGHYEQLLPCIGESFESALQQTDERIAGFTKSSGGSIRLPGLDTLRSRTSRPKPAAEAGEVPAEPTAAVAPEPAVPAAAVPATAAPVPAPVMDAPARPEEPPVPATPHRRREKPPVAPSPPEEPSWTEQLAGSAAFETKPAPPAPPAQDRWADTLALVRDNFGADECWVFLPQAGGESLPLRHGTGERWRRLAATAALRPDERTVFGICLTRRENVVIHDTAEPKLAPYLPEWFRRAEGRPGSFLLLPLHDASAGKRGLGLVLVGWRKAQRLELSAARTELARQALYAAFTRITGSASGT